MSTPVYIAVVIIAGYLLGSVSTSVLLSRFLFREDVRAQGSGNAGATNMARVYGMLPGIAVLLLDGLKAYIACAIGKALLGDLGFCLAGCTCIIGHCYPVFFKFSGGKGVSVGAILALLLDYRVFLAVLVLFIALFAAAKIVSLCSVSCAVAIPILSVLFRLSTPRIVLAAFIAVLVVYRHRENIRRLIRGEEKQFKPGRRHNR